MAEKKHNPVDNLIPTSERSKEEARELGRKGGIASGKARAEKKLLSQIYAEMLAEEHNVNIDGIGQKITGQKLVKMITLKILLKADNSTVTQLANMAKLTETQDNREIIAKLEDILTEIESR